MTKVKKIVSKITIKQIFSLVSLTAIFFTILIGVIVINMSSKMNSEITYILSYGEYTKLLEEIKENVFLIESNLVQASQQYDSLYENNINDENNIILDCIAKYDSTEYEDDIEGEHMDYLKNSYNEFYNSISENLNMLKNGQAIENFDYTLRNQVLEDINWLVEYLSYWTNQDFESIMSLYYKMRIKYYIILAICIVSFCVATKYIINLFSKEMNIINNALQEMASGNLSLTLKCRNTTEFDSMKSNINTSIDSFKNIILGLKDKSNKIDDRAEFLNNSSLEFMDSTKRISCEMDKISLQMKEQNIDNDEIINILDNFTDNISEFISSLHILNNNSNNITHNANISNEKLDEVNKAFVDIKELVSLFIIRIKALESYIKEISGTADLINQIAEETTLLALNASIESARVGEAGKGFAIVASEISNLAEQSRDSSNNISELITRITTDTVQIIEDGNTLNDKIYSSLEGINHSLDLFKEIINSTYDIGDKIDSLNKSSKYIEDQTNIVQNKINKSLTISKNISDSTENVINSLDKINIVTKDVSATAETLNNLTTDMHNEIQIFKTIKND